MKILIEDFCEGVVVKALCQNVKEAMEAISRLDEEIEMLKNYIPLEMTRFENKFNFILT